MPIEVPGFKYNDFCFRKNISFYVHKKLNVSFNKNRVYLLENRYLGVTQANRMACTSQIASHFCAHYLCWKTSMSINTMCCKASTL